MFKKYRLKIAIAGLAVTLLGVCAALAVIFMPTKSGWASDYRQYESTLANDDPLRQALDPMLADGRLSIWEISAILCGEDQGCRLNNFADILLSPEAADMFAQTVLMSLQHRKVASD
jgi:hypothetical protein